eukprot:9144341-Prorocentrum_lima.AAC.1
MHVRREPVGDVDQDRTLQEEDPTGAHSQERLDGGREEGHVVDVGPHPVIREQPGVPEPKSRSPGARPSIRIDHNEEVHHDRKLIVKKGERFLQPFEPVAGRKSGQPKDHRIFLPQRSVVR